MDTISVFVCFLFLLLIKEIQCQKQSVTDFLSSQPLNSKLIQQQGQDLLFGSVPTSIGRFSQLTLLNLSGNSITGEIPSELGSLKKLWYLNLGQNQLTGTIPSELQNAFQPLVSEQLTFKVYDNYLRGKIPEAFAERLKEFTFIEVENNCLDISTVDITNKNDNTGIFKGFAETDQGVRIQCVSLDSHAVKLGISLRSPAMILIVIVVIALVFSI